MSAANKNILELAPLILKIHHFINTNLEFPDVEKDHGSLKYNEKHSYQEYISNLDTILQFLSQSENIIKDEIKRFEGDWKYNAYQIKEKMRLMKRAIKLL